ncbi:DUF421 domain-containing protein [Tepidibacter thalassicus]|uniref:Uncharacterized membrane protein YcaP, DUF421 family n=1 Tax=Tepidibacter thalassicus DSM 15285 TaxID=1123350 RepID=A0A1M5T933_9FIRM|nr:DUF421 domain-containing protein [Tepidibacter thalassicus]SHH47285.1 Uncharacterized membrane protein YcaP, DUF421 family [Tepidibacter thalassicus DSM 15285]
MDRSLIFSLTLELTVGFLALLTVTYFLRKTQINQITPFDFISALILGELVGNAIYDKETNILYILYAILLWTCLMYVVEIITQKFKKTRSFLEGNPSILIRHGQIDFKQLQKEKLDINELQSLLRSKDVFSIREVEYAILEPSGSISVLKKSKYENPINEDLNLPEKPVHLPVTFILDGEVLWDNVKSCGFNEKWLKKQLHANNIDKIKNILYADWKKDEGIYIIKKKNI